MDEVSAIVLAAGYSSRMGGLKPLLDLGGRTLLQRAVGAFTAVGIDDVIVVTGHRGEEVGAAAEELGARAVANPRYDDGMYTSVQAGVAALESSRRFFLLPVDCPLVRPETVGRLARASFSADSDVVVPVRRGVTGHPPLLAAVLHDEIGAADPPGGLRELLAEHAGRTALVDVADPGVTMDADTAEDLVRLREAAVHEDLPGEGRCVEILYEHGASAALVAHADAVTSVAAALAMALNERDQFLCVPLVISAALLHDIARGRPRHAEAGADQLSRLGYPRVAALVRRHMRLNDPPGGALDEAHVVYLADKLVQDDRLVTVDERFAARLARFGDAGAREGVLARRGEAERVLHRVEAVLGRSLGGSPSA
jgi:molybdenum cofactor cytidylyltransferase